MSILCDKCRAVIKGKHHTKFVNTKKYKLCEDCWHEMTDEELEPFFPKYGDFWRQ